MTKVTSIISIMERGHPYPDSKDGYKVLNRKFGTLIEGRDIPDYTGREWLREAFRTFKGTLTREVIYGYGDLPKNYVRPRGRTSFEADLDDYESQQNIAEFGVGFGNPAEED